MYKLPMFGCNDASQVLTEIQNATKTFPTAYIRFAAMLYAQCFFSRPDVYLTSYSCMQTAVSVSTHRLSS